LLKPTASYAFGILQILIFCSPLRQTYLAWLYNEKFFLTLILINKIGIVVMGGGLATSTYV